MKTFLKKIVVTILSMEARLVLWRHHPRSIAITGSVGKTTTKDAVYAVVSAAYPTRKSLKSLNSDVGVPLAILGLENAWGSPIGWIKNIIRGIFVIFQPYPAMLVLEVGADHPGDIATIARWLQPEIALLTSVPAIPAHVGYFSSPEEVVQEKLALARNVREGGFVILNADDTRLIQEEGKFVGRKTFTYGLGEHAALNATHIDICYRDETPVGMQFRIDRKGSSIPVMIEGAVGTPRVYAALAALAVGEVLGVDILDAVEALKKWQPAPGRMRVLDGLHGSILIDDSYNSSPAAALSALDTLAHIQARRRIAVLGDMRELGAYSAEAHTQVGKRAAEVVDLLVTVGEETRVLADTARENGLAADKIFSFGYEANPRECIKSIGTIGRGDVILIKGSQNRIRLERVTKELMVHPKKAKELLVRQEVEWEQV